MIPPEFPPVVMIALDPKFRDSELDPDTERMIRVAAGDRLAFDELVTRHFSSTVRIISSMMGSHTHSEDLAQDVFLRVYRSRQRYLPTARFTTWLGTITRNVVLNAKRTLSRRRVYPTQFCDDPDQVGEQTASMASPSVEYDNPGLISQRETTLLVRDAVDRLPQRQRRALELVHFGGLPYSQAAREMATTRKAVKSLLGRGRVSLKQALRRDPLVLEAVQSNRF